MNQIKLYIYILPALLIWSAPVQSQHQPLEALEVTYSHSLHQVNTEWINQNGDTLKLADFEGKPAIVIMFYGKCTGTCPVLIHNTWNVYGKIKESLQNEVKVLAVSFDYKNDTPEALKTYARDEQLLLPNWHFVTSSRASIRELAMLLGVQYRERNDGHFDHTNLITILAPDGQIAERIDGIKGDWQAAARVIETITGVVQ